MKFKLVLLVLFCTVSNFAHANKPLQKAWIKHHYECVSPYLEQIHSTIDFDRKKNKNQLIQVINNLEDNYERVYSKNRIKHYIKQARELMDRSHKLYQDQIWHDKENANINLYVPEYCFTMMKYQLNQYHKVDIEKYFSDEDYVIDGFKEEATLVLLEGLSGALSFMTDAMYSVVSIDGYRSSLKSVLQLTYPKTYAECFAGIDYGNGVYKKYYSSINSELDSEFKSTVYQQQFQQDKRELDLTYNVLMNRIGVSVSDISKDMIRVNEGHEYYKFKEKTTGNIEESVNSANKLMNEISNFKYMLISYMSKTIKDDPTKFNEFKDEYVCSAVARVHRNNGYLNGYLTPREMKKYHRDYYKSLE